MRGADPEDGDESVSAGADASTPELFRAALADKRAAELDRGLTMVGPHRDDLVLRVRGLPVKGYASHGESWSVALALRLASAELLRADSPAGDPVLILDDVFAELDTDRRARLAALAADYEQVVVTAAVEEDVPAGAGRARRARRGGPHRGGGVRDGHRAGLVRRRGLAGCGARDDRDVPAPARARAERGGRAPAPVAGVVDDDNAPFAPGRDPKGLGDALSDLTREAGWVPQLAREDLVLQWDDVAGEDTARHAQPVALTDGMLTIRCDSTAWAKQLQLMRSHILSQILSRHPDAGVTSVRFVGPDVPSWKWGPRAIPGRGPRDTYG